VFSPRCHVDERKWRNDDEERKHASDLEDKTTDIRAGE
jgi:hypothetical protein